MTKGMNGEQSSGSSSSSGSDHIIVNGSSTNNDVLKTICSKFGLPENRITSLEYFDGSTWKQLKNIDDLPKPAKIRAALDPSENESGASSSDGVVVEQKPSSTNASGGGAHFKILVEGESNHKIEVTAQSLSELKKGIQSSLSLDKEIWGVEYWKESNVWTPLEHLSDLPAIAKIRLQVIPTPASSKNYDLLIEDPQGNRKKQVMASNLSELKSQLMKQLNKQHIDVIEYAAAPNEWRVLDSIEQLKAQARIRFPPSSSSSFPSSLGSSSSSTVKVSAFMSPDVSPTLSLASLSPASHLSSVMSSPASTLTTPSPSPPPYRGLGQRTAGLPASTTHRLSSNNNNNTNTNNNGNTTNTNTTNTNTNSTSNTNNTNNTNNNTNIQSSNAKSEMILSSQFEALNRGSSNNNTNNNSNNHSQSSAAVVTSTTTSTSSSSSTTTTTTKNNSTPPTTTTKPNTNGTNTNTTATNPTNAKASASNTAKPPAAAASAAVPPPIIVNHNNHNNNKKDDGILGFPSKFQGSAPASGQNVLSPKAILSSAKSPVERGRPNLPLVTTHNNMTLTPTMCSPGLLSPNTPTLTTPTASTPTAAKTFVASGPVSAGSLFIQLDGGGKVHQLLPGRQWQCESIRIRFQNSFFGKEIILEPLRQTGTLWIEKDNGFMNAKLGTVVYLTANNVPCVMEFNGGKSICALAFTPQGCSDVAARKRK